MRILVAEDDALYRAMFQRLLSPEYEPTFAEDGNAAWKLLQLEDAPQLVILDWLMPGMNGVDVCRKLRAIPEKEALYILMATAKQDIDDVLMAFDAGANDYITKPFNALELKARFKRRPPRHRVAGRARPPRAGTAGGAFPGQTVAGLATHLLLLQAHPRRSRLLATTGDLYGGSLRSYLHSWDLSGVL